MDARIYEIGCGWLIFCDFLLNIAFVFYLERLSPCQSVPKPESDVDFSTCEGGCSVIMFILENRT